MRSIDDTRRIGEAWDHATSLSADGQLQQAIMEFLRLRKVLRDQNSQLQCFDAVPAGRDGLPGPACQGTGAAQSEALPARAKKGAGAVIDKLLSKVDEELRSHLQFLQGNPYAALQLPLLRGAGRKTSNTSWDITDALVKSNYRRLALRFHPDKTGGTDSSPLFAVIRTAYETLATSRDRALYKPAPTDDGGAEFCWAVEVGAVSTRRSTVGGGVAGTTSRQSSVARANGDCPRGWESTQNTTHSSSSRSSDAAASDRTDRCRRNTAAGFQDELGASRQRGHEAGGHGAREKKEPGSGGNKEKGYVQDRPEEVEIGGQGDGLVVEGQPGRRVESDPGTPSAAPKQTKGFEEKQPPAQDQMGQSQSGEGEKDDGEVVGFKVGHHTRVGAERSSKASQPSDSSPAPFAGEGGSHQLTAPLASHQQPRKHSDEQSEEENNDTGVRRHSRTTAVPLPSQPAATWAASCPRTPTQPPPENTAAWGSDAVATPSTVASTCGSSGERNQTEGERTVGSFLFHGISRDQGLETIGSSLSDDTSSSGGSGRDGARDCGYGGAGGGSVERLRKCVSTRGRDQYQNGTACTSPTHAYDLQREVDFWVSGARREGVLRKHAPVDGGVVHTAVAKDSTPIGVGSMESSRQQALHSPRQRRRGRGFPPQRGGDEVDRLVRATMSDDGSQDGDSRLVFARNSNINEYRSAAAAARTRHSADKTEISSTTAAAGAGRGWFWGPVT